MSKTSKRGYVVVHKDSKVQYAVSPSNFSTKVHEKVRDLEPWETVSGYKPRRKKTATQPSTDTATGPSKGTGTTK